MKNFLVLCVTAALGYFGYDAFQLPPPARVARVAAATPAPVIAPKVYFHSALDAPAMRTNMSSGTSYFSTDPNSRFSSGYNSGLNSGYNSGLNGGYWGGSSTFIVTPGGGSSAPANRSGLTGASSQAHPSYWRENVSQGTPNPNGTAR